MYYLYHQIIQRIFFIIYIRPIKELSKKYIDLYKTANQDSWNRCKELFSEDIINQFKESTIQSTYFT